MKEISSNGVIHEIEAGSNFGYILDNDNYFINTDYKVLKNQNSKIFVPCMKMKYNGKTELYYMIDEYRNLLTMLNEIKSDTLISIMINIFASVIEVKNNGFLQCQNIDISLNKIFVDPKTLKVMLVYLPINTGIFDNYIEFENQLRSNLVKCFNNKYMSSSTAVDRFVADLMNGSMTINRIYDKYKGTGIQSLSRANAMNSMRVQRNYGNDMNMKLVAMDAPGYFEIRLDRPRIVIGKKQSLVDVVISFNKLISRKHCSIINDNGRYYVIDECSANGTYVNGMRIGANKSVPIHRGDIIRLADSNFQLV